MNTEKEIPEEIDEWIHDQYDHEGDIPTFRGGAEAMYRHLAPEIASLKAERGAYRKALEEIEKIETYQDPQNGNIIYRSGVGMIAISALDKYPSPKE